MLEKVERFELEKGHEVEHKKTHKEAKTYYWSQIWLFILIGASPFKKEGDSLKILKHWAWRKYAYVQTQNDLEGEVVQNVNPSKNEVEGWTKMITTNKNGLWDWGNNVCEMNDMLMKWKWVCGGKGSSAWNRDPCPER